MKPFRRRRTVAAALAVAASLAQAAEAPLQIHYNDRPPQHYNEHGVPRGAAIDRLAAALRAAAIPYEFHATPAKEQLVILQAGHERACMLAWVDLPGRTRNGKFSAVIYTDTPRGSQRRLWCTRAVPDEMMQRLDAALDALSRAGGKP
jgi:hypothetical protein